MENKKATIIDRVHPDLLIPPHIVGKLFHLVMLTAEQEYERLNNYPETSAHNLLKQFVTIHHEIEGQDYEHLGAYAEAIIAKGREEADKRFPILGEHIRKCSSCKSTLEE